MSRPRIIDSTVSYSPRTRRLAAMPTVVRIGPREAWSVADLVTVVRAARPRRTLAMISSAVLCQAKGSGSSFHWSAHWSMISMRWSTLVKLDRRSCLSVSSFEPSFDEVQPRRRGRREVTSVKSQDCRQGPVDAPQFLGAQVAAEISEP